MPHRAAGPRPGNDGGEPQSARALWVPARSHGRHPSLAGSATASETATADDDGSTASAPQTCATLVDDGRQRQEARDARRGPAIKIYRRGKDGRITGAGTAAAQQTDAKGVPLKLRPVTTSPILFSMPGVGSSIAGREAPDILLIKWVCDFAGAVERYILSLGTFDFLFLHLFLSFLPVRVDHITYLFLGFVAMLERARMLWEGQEWALLGGMLGLVAVLDLVTYRWMRMSSMLTTLADIVVYSQFTVHLASPPVLPPLAPGPVDPAHPSAKEAAAAMESQPNPNFTIYGITLPHLAISLLWSAVLLKSLSISSPGSFRSALMQSHIVATSIHGGLRDSMLRYAEMKTELSARVDRVRGERWRDYVGRVADEVRKDPQPQPETKTGAAAAAAVMPSKPVASPVESTKRTKSHSRQGSTSSLGAGSASESPALSRSGNRFAPPSSARNRKAGKGATKDTASTRKEIESNPISSAALAPVKAAGAAAHARRLASMEDPSSTDPAALYANFYESEDRFELIFHRFLNDPNRRNGASEKAEFGWIVPASLKASLYIALKIDGELRRFRQEREREAALSVQPSPSLKRGGKKASLKDTTPVSSNPVMEELLKSIESEESSSNVDEGDVRVSAGLLVPISRVSVKINGKVWPRENWFIEAQGSQRLVASSNDKYAWWDADGDEDDVWTAAPVRMMVDLAGLAGGQVHEIKVGILGFWSVVGRIYLRRGSQDGETAKSMSYEEQANQLISEAFGHSKPAPATGSGEESGSLLSTSPFASMSSSALRARMEKDQEATRQAENAIKRLRRDHQRNLTALKDEIAALKKTIAKEEASDERNRKRMQVLGEQMENLRLTADSVEDEMASFRSQLAVEEARRDAIGKELKELRKKKERMERLAASGGGQKQQAEFAELEAQIAQQDKNNRHLQATISKLSAKIFQLNINREELNARIGQEREKQLQAALERQRQEALDESYLPLIEQLRAQIENLRLQNESTADILAQERAFNDTIRSEMRKVGIAVDNPTPVERMEAHNGDGLPLL